MRKILLCVGAGLLLCGAAGAEESSVISPDVISQRNLANKLVALGDARKDPLLLIAAAKIQKNLDLPPGQACCEHPVDVQAILERARKYANGRSDIVGLADDVAVMKFKGFEFDSNSGQAHFTF